MVEELKRDETYTICSFKAVFESGLDVEMLAILNTKGNCQDLLLNLCKSLYEKFRANKALKWAVELGQ